MEKIDYLLNYLSELQAQWQEAHRVDASTLSLELWDRIVKVNDQIEKELELG